MDVRGFAGQRSSRIRHRRCGRCAVALLMVATPWLGGCSYLGDWARNGLKVGPNYQTPAAPVADQWIEFNNPRIISQACGVDEAAWWRSFHDPVLDDLALTAYHQNLPLRVAALRVLEAQAQRAIAVGELFPQLQEATGGFEQRQRSLEGFTNGLLSTQRAHGAWGTGFNASWEFDVWGRFRRAVESADANLDALVHNYDDVLVTLIADTAAAYIEMRAFQQRLRHNRANVLTQEKSLHLAEERFRNGIVTKLDVTEAQASVRQTRALTPLLEQDLRTTNDRLCLLLGIPTRDLVQKLGNTEEATIPNPPQEVVVGIPAELIRRRPDVRRAEREAAAQSALVGVATADLFPMFGIKGTLTWQATKLNDLFTPETGGGIISPGFNWNILNYGRIVNNIKVQDARFQQATVTYFQTVLNADREAEDAIASFFRSRERADELAGAVKAVAESVALAQLHYQQGWIDFDRLNNLQLNLAVQQDAWVAAQADVALGLIQIYRALGGGWQLRCEDAADHGTQSIKASAQR